MKALLLLLIVCSIFLPTFADRKLYYRILGHFYCHGQPIDINVHTVENDLIGDDVYDYKIVNGTLDIFDRDQDSFIWGSSDRLELALVVPYECGTCKSTITHDIPKSNQFEEARDAYYNPVDLGNYELSQQCYESD